jgi:hypothetical protein
MAGYDNRSTKNTTLKLKVDNWLRWTCLESCRTAKGNIREVSHTCRNDHISPIGGGGWFSRRPKAAGSHPANGLFVGEVG